MVIWNTRTEVVNMVVADIPRKPVHYSWQLVKGTALHRAISVIPLLVRPPVGIFKLVLHVKKPNS